MRLLVSHLPSVDLLEHTCILVWVTCMTLAACSQCIWKYVKLNIWFLGQTCVLTSSCFRPNYHGPDSWDALPTHCVITFTTADDCLLCRIDEGGTACVGSYREYRAEEGSIAYAWSLCRDSVLKKAGYLTSEASLPGYLLGKIRCLMPEAFCGSLPKTTEYLTREAIHIGCTEEDWGTLCRKLLWQRAEEDWVAYTRSFLLWHADWVPYIYTLDISAVDYLYEKNLSDCPSCWVLDTWHLLACFWV
jgi:hypothetical protein